MLMIVNIVITMTLLLLLLQAGWSIWMEYDKLPPLQQAVLNRRCSLMIVMEIMINSDDDDDGDDVMIAASVE